MRLPHRLRPGFRLIFWREFSWLRRRPALLVFATLLPIGLIALLMGIFSAGLPTRLPIAVLDQDGSTLSRHIIRQVDATPEAAVIERVGDLAEGRRHLTAGQVYGLLLIPQNLERDLLAGRRPEIVFFYTTQKMTAGNLVMRGVAGAVPAVAAGARIGWREAQGQFPEAAQAALAPIPVQTHALFNPTLDYSHFLLSALVPSVLQIIIVTATAYTVGLDTETRHRLRLLRRLGGGLWPAVAGKLLPYTLLFLGLLGVADAILFGGFGMPLRGSGGLLLIADLLFVLACQALGAVLGLVLTPTANAVSIATLLTGPAFGFMGIGFPRLGMNAFAHSWGAALPGTWYLSARIDQTLRGVPPELGWPPILTLAAFVVGLGGLLAFRLETLRARRQR